MNGTAKGICVALLLAAAAHGQQLDYATLCSGTNPPEGGAANDDFCHLWARGNHQGMRNALGIAIRTARAAENRNRWYFDRKRGAPRGLYIQLRRPWMNEAAADYGDDPGWEIVHVLGGDSGWYYGTAAEFAFRWSPYDGTESEMRFNIKLEFVPAASPSAQRLDAETLGSILLSWRNTARSGRVVARHYVAYGQKPTPAEAKEFVECFLDEMHDVMYEGRGIDWPADQCGWQR